MAGTLTISTLSDGTNSTSATNAIQGSAKAWVKFNNTTINASYNVSSITNASTGRYNINLTNALADANYCVVVGTRDTVTNPGGNNIFEGTGTSTSSVFYFSHWEGTSLANVSDASAVFFR